MNLVPWTRFHDATMVQNELNRLFDSTMRGWAGDAETTSNWMPSADICETDGDLLVVVDLPGIRPDNIDVHVENNVLTIRGERAFDRDPSKEKFHRVERAYGAFARSFTLSTAVNADAIKANYQDGVLTITLPKAEHAKPRRIQIAAAAA